jgi:hypothetical protein
VNDNSSGEFLRLPQLTSLYTHFRLIGSCHDVLGTTTTIDERVDIKEAWDLAVAAHELLPHDYEQETVKALEGIGKTLAQLQTNVFELLPARPDTGPELRQLVERIGMSLRGRVEPRLRRSLWQFSGWLDRG